MRSSSWVWKWLITTLISYYGITCLVEVLNYRLIANNQTLILENNLLFLKNTLKHYMITLGELTILEFNAVYSLLETIIKNNIDLGFYDFSFNKNSIYFFLHIYFELITIYLYNVKEVSKFIIHPILQNPIYSMIGTYARGIIDTNLINYTHISKMLEIRKNLRIEICNQYNTYLLVDLQRLLDYNSTVYSPELIKHCLDIDINSEKNKVKLSTLSIIPEDPEHIKLYDKTNPIIWASVIAVIYGGSKFLNFLAFLEVFEKI